MVRAARVRHHLDRPAASPLAACVRRPGAQRAGTTHRGRAPRLDAAQPDGGRPQPRHPRLSRRRARPHCLRCGLHVARRLHLLGRRARARLGRALLASRAQGRPAGQRRLWRVLAPGRVDGPAAPPQGAGHLLPPQAPRRQTRLQRRPAALLRLRPPRWPCATGRSSPCWRCWSPCRTASWPWVTPSSPGRARRPGKAFRSPPPPARGRGLRLQRPAPESPAAPACAPAHAGAWACTPTAWS